MINNHRLEQFEWSGSTPKSITKRIKQAAAAAVVNQRPYEKVILHAGIGGLCNRLRSLCACLYLSDYWEIPLLLCWYPDDACNACFYDLFEPICETISVQALLKLLGSDSCSNILYVSVGEAIYQQHLKNEIAREIFRKQRLKFFKQLKPKEHILQDIDNFSQQYLDADTVGLHIRGTDLYQHLKSRNLDANFSSDEKFINAIEYEVKNGCSNFFLATDDELIQNNIEEKFSNKVVRYCQEFNCDNKRQTSIQNALIDLYLLSKCKKIIGSYYSSFSQYAADLGNIPLIYP